MRVRITGHVTLQAVISICFQYIMAEYKVTRHALTLSFQKGNS